MFKKTILTILFQYSFLSLNILFNFYSTKKNPCGLLSTLRYLVPTLRYLAVFSATLVMNTEIFWTGMDSSSYSSSFAPFAFSKEHSFILDVNRV